jgi:diacylglycerol kinase family enzyme
VVRIVVIANPGASQFTGGGHRDVMAALSQHHDVEAIWPAGPAETTEAATEAAQSGIDVVVAMGGDGMVHHVGQGLVGSPAVLGIVPAGTTNVIARLFDIPSKPARAAKLVAANPEPLSIGLVTLELRRGSVETTHHAFFAAGFGLDAEVVSRADRDPYKKYRFGSIHYARTALGVALGRYASTKPHVDMRLGDGPKRVSAAMVQFREIYTYFGRLPLRLGPEAPAPMTVLTVAGLRRRRVPRVATIALLGRELSNVPGLDLWEEVTGFDFAADPPIAVQADGEALGMADGGEVTWAPDALRVLTGPNTGV